MTFKNWAVEYTYRGKVLVGRVMARSAIHAIELFGLAPEEKIVHVWPVNEFRGHR